MSGTITTAIDTTITTLLHDDVDGSSLSAVSDIRESISLYSDSNGSHGFTVPAEVSLHLRNVSRRTAWRRMFAARCYA